MTETKPNRRLRDYPLLGYASEKWGEHAAEVEDSYSDEDIRKLAKTVARLLERSTASDAAYEMISKGEDVTGFTSWHWLAMWDLPKSYKLLKTTFDDTGASDRRGRTPLMYAIEGGGTSMAIELLRSVTADPNAKNDLELTPLLMSAYFGDQEVVKALLQFDVDVNARDDHDATPLVIAAAGGRRGIVSLLLQSKKVDVNARDYLLCSALPLAVKRGDENLVEQLLHCEELDINLQNENRKTPLILAVASGRDEVVQLLLGNKTLLTNLADENGQTAFTYAAAAGHESVVKLFMQSQQVSVESRDSPGHCKIASPNARRRC